MRYLVGWVLQALILKRTHAKLRKSKGCQRIIECCIENIRGRPSEIWSQGTRRQRNNKLRYRLTKAKAAVPDALPLLKTGTVVTPAVAATAPTALRTLSAEDLARIATLPPLRVPFPAPRATAPPPLPLKPLPPLLPRAPPPPPLPHGTACVTTWAQLPATPPEDAWLTDEVQHGRLLMPVDELFWGYCVPLEEFLGHQLDPDRHSFAAHKTECLYRSHKHMSLSRN